MSIKNWPGGVISDVPPTPSGPYQDSTASGVWTLEQQAYWEAQNLWPTAGNPPPDAQFNYVTMLLHGDGTNGAQNNTFLDSSTNNFTITRNGNTTQGSFSPYGPNWSNFFDGSGDYLSVPYTTANFDWWTSGVDYTIEAWVFATNLSTWQYIDGTSAVNPVMVGNAAATTATNYWSFGPLSDGTVSFKYYNGASVSVVSTATITANTWNHVAMTKTSSGITVFVNGVAGTATAISGTPQSSTGSNLQIGQINSTSVSGYISNLRIVRGTAVYSGNFTPSTTPLTAVTNTKLLTCQSNRFVDNSTNALTVSITGNTSVQRVNPFGTATAYDTSVIGGSGYFDGSGDYLTTSSGSIALNTNNFTMECWVYPTTSGGQIVFDCRSGSNSNKPTLGVVSLQLVYQTSGVNRIVGGSTPLNTWSHLAVVKNSGTTYAYVNGVQVGTYTDSNDYGTVTRYMLGADDDGSPNAFFNGYISNARFVLSAVYTSAFTPPTAPVTAITNTQFLANFTNGAIFDNAMMNDLETVGNAQISTSVKKYGTGSIAFDGANPFDYLVAPVSPNLGFGTGNFTIEGWCYVTSTSSTYQCMVSIGPPVQIYARSSTIEVYFNDTDDTNTYIVNGMTGPASSVSANTWFHFAVVRNGTTFTAYVNGVGGTPVTGVSAQVALSATPLALGNYGITPNTLLFTGYMDDLRITKGVARYTANFTPPTAAFANFGPN